MIPKITNGVALGDYLDVLFEDSVKQALHAKGLEEKEKQISLAPANKQSSGSDQSSKKKDDEPRDFDDMKDKENSKTMQDDSEAMHGGEIKMDDIVEKLNTIRSGKSFKDSLVQQRFDQYFNSLKPAEKTAMFAFLKGIAGIVTGEVETQQAADPQKADITMHKGPDVQKKHVKPNVIKTPDNTSSKPKSSGSGEDTSAPVQAKRRG